MPHSDDLNHLVTGHPDGLIISFSKQTHGNQEWQKLYNYPDYGGYFIYQDFKNQILGQTYAVGGFYNFYFAKRKLTFKIAQGIAYATNPQEKVSNSKNSAFGSTFLANTNFVLAYKKDNIIDRVGFQSGIIFTHFSNGRFESPNSGINTYGLYLGLNYNLDKEIVREKDTIPVDTKFKEPIRYNFIVRTGINESPIIDSGQHSFFHVGFYADKRLNKKSALQLGTEIFFSNFYKDFIKFQSVAYPEEGIDPNTDYKRVGLFIGHELFINRISIEIQLGYYVYQPYKYDIPVYDRVGMKYYLTNKIYTGLSVKTHGFLAEALEFAVGVRL
jgi:Lipid A 3-O-deacylase (PagL)